MPAAPTLTSHELDVEVPQADRPAACLATERERLDQQLVEVMAVLGALTQLVGAGAQPCVVERLELGFQLVDGSRDRRVALDFPLVRVEELGEIEHGG